METEIKQKYATYVQAGLLRCCAKSVPVDDDDKVLAGKEGQHIPCKYCKDKTTSGVRLVSGVWKAAWIDRQSA